MMNGYFGHSIPIYWGAPDIAKIVNMDRIIHLDISREEMDEAWKLYEVSRILFLFKNYSNVYFSLEPLVPPKISNLLEGKNRQLPSQGNSIGKHFRH